MEHPPPTYYAEEEDSDIMSIGTLDADSDDDPVVTIHPIESMDGVLVKVQPPIQPIDYDIHHVPCDIVLVIDASESGNFGVPMLANGQKVTEHFGLAIMDIIKYAARMIVSTLNEGDRLGIITFDHEAKLVQGFVPMTEAYKEEVNSKIDCIYASNNTNLWAGISGGLKFFESGDESRGVPALMLLTAGSPDCRYYPDGGYVKSLRSLSPLPAIINTFGFGFLKMRSGLLKSIAEIGNGSYSFIPEVGSIRTAVVHAVAHLQSTYATRCTLKIQVPEGVLLTSPTGRSVDDWRQKLPGKRTMTVQLGNLQYGQSRDIYLQSVDENWRKTTFRINGQNRMMKAKLKYSRMQSRQETVFTDQDMLETSPLSKSVIAYHQSRSMVCYLLSSFFLLYDDMEYHQPNCIEQFQRDLKTVLAIITARNYAQDRQNMSLLLDLNGPIREALETQFYLERWGSHYLLSLWNAHAKQLCNSFRDSGPLMYNDNAFFIKCRDVLNKNCSDIPLALPIAPNTKSASRSKRGRSSISPYAAPRKFVPYKPGPLPDFCFAASSPVLLATGLEVPVYTLQQGMKVQAPLGPRRVQAVLKNTVLGRAMCRVGGLTVTPWHPINTDLSEHEIYGQSGWVFPMNVAKDTTYSGVICSVLLEPDGDVDAHAIRIGGVWGVTLGHGVLKGSDARAHPFFGDYNAISKELSGFGPGENGVYWGLSLRKDGKTGLACGFERSLSLE